MVDDLPVDVEDQGGERQVGIRRMAGKPMPSPDSTNRERKLLLAVDAPSLLHRNHHARVESGLLDRGGQPAWALHGMLRQLARR